MVLDGGGGKRFVRVNNANKSVTATFVKTQYKNLSITTPKGCKTWVSKTPDGYTGLNPLIEGTTGLAYAANFTVQLKCLPVARSLGQNYVFDKWSGSGVPVGHERDETLQVLVDRDMTVKAEVTKAYSLTIGKLGVGDVTPPVGVTTYAAGEVVTVEATPASNFLRWRGAKNSSTSTVEVTMDSNKYLGAWFKILGAESFVNIHQASVTEDLIEVAVGPTGQAGTGTLSLELRNSEGTATATFLTGTVNSAQTIQFPFNPSNLPEGVYFTGLRATWTVGGVTYTDDFMLSPSFTYLGSYIHSRYNVPSEIDATCGTGTVTCWLQSGSSFQTISLKDTFRKQVKMNGTGLSENYSYIHYDEGLGDANHPTDFTFMQVSAPPSRCSGCSVDGGTVARNVNNNSTRCNDKIFIYHMPAETPGTIKTVTDYGPLHSTNQFDNFAPELTACSGITDWSAGAPTLRLGR